jgi:hypothetical protein
MICRKCHNRPGLCHRCRYAIARRNLLRDVYHPSPAEARLLSETIPAKLGVPGAEALLLRWQRNEP